MHWAVWTRASSHLTSNSHIRQCCAPANKPCLENAVTGHCGTVLCYIYSLHLMAPVPTSCGVSIMWPFYGIDKFPVILQMFFIHFFVPWHCLCTSFPVIFCLAGVSDKWLRFACVSAFVHRELLLHTPGLLGGLWTTSQLRWPGKQIKIIKEQRVKQQRIRSLHI